MTEKEFNELMIGPPDLTEEQKEVALNIANFLESLGDDSKQISKKLEEMGIKGYKGVATSCPLANALRNKFNYPYYLEVDSLGVGVEVGGTVVCFMYNEKCAEFIKDFDKGKYPQLVKYD